MPRSMFDQWTFSPAGPSNLLRTSTAVRGVYPSGTGSLSMYMTRGMSPVLAMVMLPYVFWRPGLVLAIPLAAVYSGVLYGVTLKPLSRLLQRREHSIWAAVTAQE